MTSIERPNCVKDDVETVTVSVVIPAGIAATVNLPKLSKAKRVLLTLQVTAFDLRPPVIEIDHPACVGSLSGDVVAVTKSMLKK